MKRNLVLLLIALGFVANLFSQEPPPPPKPAPPPPANDYYPDRWKDFIAVDEGFKARFPNQPLERFVVDENSEAVGKKYRSGYENFIVYQVNSTDTATAEIYQQSPKIVFETVKNKRLKSLETPAKAVSELTAMRGGCPSAYVEYDAGKDLRYRELYVLCGERFYEVSVRTFRGSGVQVMGSKNDYAEIADSFIKSFSVLDEEELKKLKSTAAVYNGKLKDEQFRFSLDFPVYPEIVETVGENGTDEITYTAESDNFIRRLIVLPVTNIFSFSEKLREKLYDNWRDGFATGSKAKVMSEGSFSYKSAKGRSLSLKLPESENEMLLRILALNGKIYVLSVFDSGKIKSAERAKSAAETSDKFFNSFEKLFEAFPPQYYGILYNDVYTSEHYGVTMNVPKDWQLEGGQVLMTFDDEREDLMFDLNEQNTLEPVFFSLTNGETEPQKKSIMTLAAKFIPYRQIKLREIVKYTSKRFSEEKNSAIELVDDYVKLDIKETEIWMATFRFKSPASENLYLRSYLLKNENYLVNLNASFTSDSDKIKIEDSIKSFRFLQK